MEAWLGLRRWHLNDGFARGLAPTPDMGGDARGTRTCRLMTTATATATMPAPSTSTSMPRSLAGTSFAGAPLSMAARVARDRRRKVATSRTARITSTTRPMTRPSCRSGPFQWGALIAPRSPARPRMISNVSGRTSGQDWSGAGRAPLPGVRPRSGSPGVRPRSASPVSPGVPARPVVPGWLLIASRSLT